MYGRLDIRLAARGKERGRGARGWHLSREYNNDKRCVRSARVTTLIGDDRPAEVVFRKQLPILTTVRA